MSELLGSAAATARLARTRCHRTPRGQWRRSGKRHRGHLLTRVIPATPEL